MAYHRQLLSRIGNDPIKNKPYVDMFLLDTLNEIYPKIDIETLKILLEYYYRTNQKLAQVEDKQDSLEIQYKCLLYYHQSQTAPKVHQIIKKLKEFKDPFVMESLMNCPPITDSVAREGLVICYSRLNFVKKAMECMNSLEYAQDATLIYVVRMLCNMKLIGQAIDLIRNTTCLELIKQVYSALYLMNHPNILGVLGKICSESDALNAMAIYHLHKEKELQHFMLAQQLLVRILQDQHKLSPELKARFISVYQVKGMQEHVAELMAI